MQNSHPQYEVVVIGAGIAGTVLTHLLLQDNINTLLIGKADNPAIKLAESLPPSARPMLERLGLSDFFLAHQPSSGYQSIWGNEHIRQAGFEARPSLIGTTVETGWKVDKTLLIQQIQAVLPQNSISTANVKSIDVATDGHTIYLDNGSQPVRATLVVDATGRQGLLSRQLGLTSHQFDQLLAYTVNVPIINHPEINQPVFIEAFEQGWGLVSKLDDKHNVLSLFTNKNSGLMAQLKNWKNWQHLTQHTKYFKHFIPTEDEYNVHCLNASSRIAAKLNADNWLLIGDAAMSFDPLSSHGMTTAIYTAEHAAKALSKARDKPFGNATDCLNDYAKKMTDIYNTYLNELVALYRLESRWSDCGFWQSKQNLIVGESPAVVA